MLPVAHGRTAVDLSNSTLMPRSAPGYNTNSMCVFDAPFVTWTWARLCSGVPTKRYRSAFVSHLIVKETPGTCRARRLCCAGCSTLPVPKWRSPQIRTLRIKRKLLPLQQRLRCVRFMLSTHAGLWRVLALASQPALCPGCAKCRNSPPLLLACTGSPPRWKSSPAHSVQRKDDTRSRSEQRRGEGDSSAAACASDAAP